MMGLKITSVEEHANGNSSVTYLHVSEYYKPKDGDKVQVATRWYTSKARRDADVGNISVPKSMAGQTTVKLDMTMADFSSLTNTAGDVYALLKTYLEGLGKTVVDEI